MEAGPISVLVLGGYGLVGMPIIRKLVAAGHQPVGLGRDCAVAARRVPEVRWIDADIARCLQPMDWHPHLLGIDAVVNASGALQDGSRDDVRAIQSAAMRALFQACIELGIRRVVQISATGAGASAATTFMRSKAEADDALAALELDWFLLRPGLVLSPGSYGATGLLRALAAMPFAIPIFGGDRPVRTVHVEDVADAVLRAVEDRVPPRTRYDLVENSAHRLDEIVRRLRAWLGSAPAPVIEIPRALGRFACWVGDLLGWLGWRTPIRTTSLREIDAGIEGDPAAWNAVAPPVAGVAESLRAMPATVQERWYARLWLLKPTAIGGLSLFWVLSGAIALRHLDSAAAILTERGIDLGIAEPATIGGAVVDIVLGAGLLVRRWHIQSAIGMVIVAVVYLIGGTLVAPDLWTDPLGPYLKVLPGVLLALIVLAIAPER